MLCPYSVLVYWFLIAIIVLGLSVSCRSMPLARGCCVITFRDSPVASAASVGCTRGWWSVSGRGPRWASRNARASSGSIAGTAALSIGTRRYLGKWCWKVRLMEDYGRLQQSGKHWRIFKVINIFSFHMITCIIYLVIIVDYILQFWLNYTKYVNKSL